MSLLLELVPALGVLLVHVRKSFEPTLQPANFIERKKSESAIMHRESRHTDKRQANSPLTFSCDAQ